MDPQQQVADTITQAVVQTAKDPTNGLQPTDARPVAETLIDKLGPLILNSTNNEPWYQSRVIWGAILTSLSTVARPIARATGYDLNVDEATTTEIINALSQGGQWAGIFLVLWGRLSTRKPIGS